MGDDPGDMRDTGSDTSPGTAPDTGSETGLSALVARHRAELLRFLAARAGSTDEAEDILQELWLRASSQATGPIGHPRAYLFRMANNLVLDRIRGRNRAMRRERRWLEAEGDGEALAPEFRPDPAETAEEALARSQEAQILHRAIAALPEGAGRALRLYRFEGLGQAEIAQTMGISRSGVEKHLALAMKKLRAALVDAGALRPAARDCGSSGAAASGQDRATGGDGPPREQGR